MLITENAKPRVFISFATPDFETVRVVADAMRPLLTPRFWNNFKTPGEEAWKTIFKEIDGCDYVIAVITDATLKRAMAVGQEIGRARAKGKLVIPVVAAGVNVSDLGSLSGVTYLRMSGGSPAALVSQIEELSKKIVEHKAKRDARAFWATLGLVVGGVVVLANLDD